MADRSVIDSVVRYLGALEDSGLSVSFGVIFGSQVTGVPDLSSDIDLLVVSSRFDGIMVRSDVDLLWHVAARVDSRIEPIPCGLRQWYDDRVSPLIEIARREGKIIEPAPRPLAAGE